MEKSLKAYPVSIDGVLEKITEEFSSLYSGVERLLRRIAEHNDPANASEMVAEELNTLERTIKAANQLNQEGVLTRGLNNHISKLTDENRILQNDLIVWQQEAIKMTKLVNKMYEEQSLVAPELKESLQKQLLSIKTKSKIKKP
jgi:hypothetical protein